MQLPSSIARITAAITASAAFSRAQASPQANLNLIGTSFGIPGNASFEYVVVGSGTASNTIAARLAQNGSSVAVVEAGGFYEIDNGNYNVLPSRATHFTGADPSDTNPLID